MTAPFTLASASETRVRLLRAAGLSFDVRPARIDERAVEVTARRLGSTHWKRERPTVALLSSTAIGEYYLRPVDY